MAPDARETGSSDMHRHWRHVLRTCLSFIYQEGSHACTTSDRNGGVVHCRLSQLQHQRLAEPGELRSEYDDLSDIGNRYGLERHAERHAHGHQHRHGDGDRNRNHGQHGYRNDYEPAAHHDTANESAAAPVMSGTYGRGPAGDCSAGPRSERYSGVSSLTTLPDDR